jgi:hypothetical protein
LAFRLLGRNQTFDPDFWSMGLLGLLGLQLTPGGGHAVQL